jgi:excinuclease ABC subunit A
MDKISVRGARTHNLKNIDVDLPRDKLVVITGLSGSGKSSLAFDTLYAEGQRRYVESLSAYARQFLSLMEKPDVDHIEGLSPAISIEQKSTSHNPRSTVGTITEIYDYLRLLFARVGTPHCPLHHLPLEAQTVSQMVDHILGFTQDTKFMVLAPIVQDRKGEHEKLLENLHQQGFIRARVDGELIELEDPPKLERQQKHTIEVVIDRLKVATDIKQRLAESIETALHLTQGIVRIAFFDQQPEIIFSANYACHVCGFSLDGLEPRLFSFNNPAGACAACDGLGSKLVFDVNKLIKEDLSLNQGAIRSWNRQNLYYYQQLEALAKHYRFSLDTRFKDLPKNIQEILLNGSGHEDIQFFYVSGHGAKSEQVRPFEGVLKNLERRFKDTDSLMMREEFHKLMTEQPCTECKGSRLNAAASNVLVDSKNLPAITVMTISEAKAYFDQLQFTGAKLDIATKILKEICLRLGFLINVGLEYLTLERKAETLSGGEAQRIRLASQIGAGLVGVMYILDEPSIGLHQRDNERLLKTLFHLRDLGNTVIVVEHDEDAIRSADFVLDIGPGAGSHGGTVVAQGTPQQVIATPTSITGQYLSGVQKIEIPKIRTKADKTKMLELKGATGNNLKDVNIAIPVGLFTCITGVSGSGKSTLINDTLYPLMATDLNDATTLSPAPYKELKGVEFFDNVIDIDQSPIGRTPRSNPATYTGLFTLIRDLFAATQEARARGYAPGRFSFNVKGGRCEACEGDGVIKVEMHFLADVYVTCDVCKGKRYNRETLEVHYKYKNIHEVLEMTVEEANEFFKNVPSIARKLETLLEVGLSYVRLGQRATTLSGGEAQRVKLAKELSRRDTGRSLYILDEPTTGLHFHDVKQLLKVLHALRDRGNTIVVIEHNLDVIKTADWIIDLGPEGGAGGGMIVAIGTPEDIIKVNNSYTGQFLKPYLAA